ncbi:MAG: hypothetical protein K2X87_01570 [Gemmataceae bacterium]|nr:hypothetical protein [Gemmataceae bacterium]
MALFTSRLLSLGPRIRKAGGKLHAVTGWRVWLLSLGLCNRAVVVDPAARAVFIRDRVCWFFPRRRRVRFDHIRAVAYGYSDPNAFGGLNLARDTFDVFSVGLKLHADGDDYQHLFRFVGEGSFTNDGPLPNWFYLGEYVFDAEGAQEGESRAFVTVLCRLTGKPVEPR